jgi:hypothetical protein
MPEDMAVMVDRREAIVEDAGDRTEVLITSMVVEQRMIRRNKKPWEKEKTRRKKGKVVTKPL